MIIELNENDNRQTRTIVRVCDVCGNKQETKAYIVLKGRKTRGKDLDLCLPCSHKREYRKQIVGENHWLWKDGISESGYKRITTKLGKRIYEHTNIFENYIGRKLLKDEIIHHIDLDKINNNINNLYLYKNRSEHTKGHYSLEFCGYNLLNKFIWFNWDSKKYVLNQTEQNKKIMTDAMKDLVKPKFDFSHLPNQHRRRQRNGIQGNLHGMIIELDIGRKLYANECIHHVNGIRDDNDINNLCLISRNEHRKTHYSLQLATIKFLNKLVVFDNGIYKVV